MVYRVTPRSSFEQAIWWPCLRSPLRAARTLCGCQPVILPSSAMLAPRRRCNWARHFESFVFARDPRCEFDFFGRSVSWLASVALLVTGSSPRLRRHADRGALTSMAPPAMPVGAGGWRVRILSRPLTRHARLPLAGSPVVSGASSHLNERSANLAFKCLDTHNQARRRFKSWAGFVQARTDLNLRKAV